MLLPNARPIVLAAAAAVATCFTVVIVWALQWSVNEKKIETTRKKEEDEDGDCCTFVPGIMKSSPEWCRIAKAVSAALAVSNDDDHHHQRRGKINDKENDNNNNNNIWKLVNCRIPLVALSSPSFKCHKMERDAESFLRVDFVFQGARIIEISPTVSLRSFDKDPDLNLDENVKSVNLGGRIVLPRFVDAHVHLTKSQLGARCVNPSKSINGALVCEAADRKRWLSPSENGGTKQAKEEEASSLQRRMHHSVQCAHVHGSRALRTHLDGVQEGNEELTSLVYRAFDSVRKEWIPKGVELQGVANLFLPHYKGEMGRTVAQAEAHVREAARHEGVVLGAYVPRRNDASAVFTHDTLQEWFQALLHYAAKYQMDVDIHIDEHNDARYEALALPAFCDALEWARSQEPPFDGHVVLGHCTALCLGFNSADDNEDDQRRRALIRRMARLLGTTATVVVNPFTNLALQDRQGTRPPVGSAVKPSVGARTPRWRGLAPIQELLEAGIQVAAASDNVRDWWFAYGDYDMLHVCYETIQLAHLDSFAYAPASEQPELPLPSNESGGEVETKSAPRTSTRKENGVCSSTWLGLASVWAAKALRLEVGSSSEWETGKPLSCCIVDARSSMELWSRPHADRLVIALGRVVEDALPSLSDLDDLVAQPTMVDWESVSTTSVTRGGGATTAQEGKERNRHLWKHRSCFPWCLEFRSCVET